MPSKPKIKADHVEPDTLYRLTAAGEFERV